MFSNNSAQRSAVPIGISAGSARVPVAHKMISNDGLRVPEAGEMFSNSSV